MKCFLSSFLASYHHIILHHIIASFIISHHSKREKKGNCSFIHKCVWPTNLSVFLLKHYETKQDKRKDTISLAVALKRQGIPSARPLARPSGPILLLQQRYSLYKTFGKKGFSSWSVKNKGRCFFAFGSKKRYVRLFHATRRNILHHELHSLQLFLA
jgi:hypothetical protein